MLRKTKMIYLYATANKLIILIWILNISIKSFTKLMHVDIIKI